MSQDTWQGVWHGPGYLAGVVSVEDPPHVLEYDLSGVVGALAAVPRALGQLPQQDTVQEPLHLRMRALDLF